jgi:hypothetical protein
LQYGGRSGDVSWEKEKRFFVPFLEGKFLHRRKMHKTRAISHSLPTCCAEFTGIHLAHITHPNDAYNGISHDGGRWIANPAWAARSQW